MILMNDSKHSPACSTLSQTGSFRPDPGPAMTLFRKQARLRPGSWACICAALWLLWTPAFSQQDKFQGVVTQGVERVRIAVADFKPMNADPNTGQLLSTFNSVLYSDLQNAGIFDVYEKITEIDEETLGRAFDELFAVNVKGCVFGVRADLSCAGDTLNPDSNVVGTSTGVAPAMHTRSL